MIAKTKIVVYINYILWPLLDQLCFALKFLLDVGLFSAILIRYHYLLLPVTPRYQYQEGIIDAVTVVELTLMVVIMLATINITILCSPTDLDRLYCLD